MADAPSSPATDPRSHAVWFDLRAGLVVYLVALPLCLGIASACGAPPISGLIAGIVGGLIVGSLSDSHVSVSGPAAGLTVVVLEGIGNFGLHTLLAATIVAGVVQMALGFVRLGRMAQVIPGVVIRGMMAAIGLILVLKQLPHALGYDRDPEGDFAFFQPDGHNTLSELVYSLLEVEPGAVVVSLVCTAAFFLWRDWPKLALRRWLPRELAVVLVGLGTGLLIEGTAVGLSAEHRVVLSVVDSWADLGALWQRPDFTTVFHPDVLSLAFTLAAVASIESLLCLEASDRIDQLPRVSSADRELVAQGTGNVISGFLGGLPVTAVVIRSSANVYAGARTRLSTIFHGLLLLVSTLLLAPMLNHIPLAALAVVLIAVGYKLTPPSLYRDIWRHGRSQFVPFIVTVAAILFTDLFTGTLLGAAFAVGFIVLMNYREGVVVTDDGNNRLIRLASNVSFLHKVVVRRALETVPTGGHIIVDGTRARSIDPDIIEVVRDFAPRAAARGVQLTINRTKASVHDYFREETRA